MAENEDLRIAQGVSWKQLELFGFKRPYIDTKDLPSKFLASKVITPIQTNSSAFPFGQISVKELTDKLQKKQLDNGRYIIINGWSINDNVYTLSLLMKHFKEIKLVFTHLLSKERGNGISSTMFIVTEDGEELPGYLIMRDVAYIKIDKAKEDTNSLEMQAYISCQSVYGAKNCDYKMTIQEMKDVIKECHELYHNNEDRKFNCGESTVGLNY